MKLFQKNQVLNLLSSRDVVSFLQMDFMSGEKKDAQPFYITLQNRELFTFAGIWEIWQSSAGKHLFSCSIITTSANEKLSNIHHRMPVILKNDDEKTWLKENNNNILQNLLTSYPNTEILLHPVSFNANSVKNNYPELIETI